MKHSLRSAVVMILVVMCLGLSAEEVRAAAKLKVAKVPVGGSFSSGDNVDFQITVTNVGTVPFVAVEVTDAQAPACYRFLTEFNGQPTLDPGAQVTYTCTKFNVTTDFSNTAKAVGFSRDAGGCLVRGASDNAQAVRVEVASPAIKVVKRALDGSDAQTVFTGGDAHFEIIVSNMGDADLEDVQVTDALAPDCERPLGSLARGASQSYTCTVRGVTRGFTNVVRVTAKAPDMCPGVVRANDSSVVRVTSPQCTLAVNKTADPITIAANATSHDVTFTYQVSNLGTAVTNVNVADDKLGVIAQGFGLASGQTQTFTVHAEILATTTNTVTVTADLVGRTETCVASDSATVTVSNVSNGDGFITFTQGGWGSPPSGGNPGALLAANFARVYPRGSVTIGGTSTLTFTSANAIQNFLPQGGRPGVLTASATNPGGSSAGVFAGQVLALQLSVDFSNARILPAGLASQRLTSGPLAGSTVAQVLALANAVLGGNTGALPAGMSISDLNDVVDRINNSFNH